MGTYYSSQMLTSYSSTRSSNRVSKVEKLDSKFLCMGIVLGTAQGSTMWVNWVIEMLDVIDGARYL